MARLRTLEDVPEKVDGTTIKNSKGILCLKNDFITINDVKVKLGQSISLESSVNVKDFGATGDGVTDDTAAIQAALDTTNTLIEFPKGNYRIRRPELDGTAAISSSVPNRIIFGNGIITATDQVKVGFDITGNDTTVNIHIDGNNFIGNAIRVSSADNCVVDGCKIHDLNGFTNYSAIAIGVYFESNDYSVSVTNNQIRNLTSEGDGSGGNGVGMSRAINISATTNISKASLVSNNTINSVGGEEGDSITIISSDGSGTYFDLPITVEGNAISLWNRRAIKAQANEVSIIGNILNNESYTSGFSGLGLQSAIDIVQGSRCSVLNNSVLNCKESPQIAAYRTGSETVPTGLVISNNIIKGIGSETTDTLISVAGNTSGTDIIISSNSVIAPNYTNTVLNASSMVNCYIVNNVVTSSSSSWLSFSSITNLKQIGNLHNSDTNYTQYIDGSGDHIFDVNVGRKILLKNRDNVLSDNEGIAEITIETNDSSSPSTEAASLRFVASGTTGGAKIIMATGNSNAPKVDKVEIGASGDLSLLTDGAGINIKNSNGVSYELGVNTSGQLTLGGTPV